MQTKSNNAELSKSSFFINFSLLLLLLPSLFSGFLLKDLFIGIFSDFWYFSIFILPKNSVGFDYEQTFFFYKLIPLLFSFFGLCLFFFFKNFFFKNFFFKNFLNYNIFFSFFFFRWLVDFFYNNYIIFLFNFLYKFIFKNLDKGFFEKVGPFGLTSVLFSFLIRILTFLNVKFNVNLYYSYVYNFLFFIVFILFFMLLMFF